MGRFEDFKETMGEAAALTEQADPLASRLYAPHAATLQPVDLTDPVWAPIDGITLDRYAQITAAMARRHAAAAPDGEAWLEDQGVKPGTWGNVQAGWVERMSTNEAVRTRYGIVYSQS